MKLCGVLLLVAAASAFDWHVGTKLIKKGFRNLAQVPKKSVKFWSGVSRRMLNAFKNKLMRGHKPGPSGVREVVQDLHGKVAERINYDKLTEVLYSGPNAADPKNIHYLQRHQPAASTTSRQVAEWVTAKTSKAPTQSGRAGMIFNPVNHAQAATYPLPQNTMDQAKMRVPQYKNADGHFVFQLPREANYNPSFAPSYQAVGGIEY